MSLAKFSIRNPVLVNIIMIAVVTYGSFALLTLPRELMPDVSFPWVFIITEAPGLSPEDSEKLITDEIEKEVKDIDGIDNITSFSRENASVLWIKFETMSDDEFDKRMQEVQAEVDKVDLPEAAEKPNVVDFSMQDHIPMISLVLSGAIPELEMKRLAENLRDDILQISNVAKCQIAGIRDREIWVEVDPAKLQSYDLTLMQVMDAIKAKNMDIPAGDIEIGRWDVIVRTVGELKKVDELKRIILKANPLGHHVRLEDIAEVKDTFARKQVISRFNSRNSITLSVSKKKQGNSIAIIDEIRALADDYRDGKMPAGAELTIINDTSVQINEFLGILQNNAVLGLVLVILSLYILIGPRNAIFAAIGIPVTFMITFILMKHGGITLSGSSLFGLVLVLGMIVDDAIVIIENCYRYMQSGHKVREAVIQGTRQVALPVLSSSMTTVAAFLPLMLMDGVIGEFLKVVPIVVTLALLASLFEAFLILPSHIADWSRGNSRPYEGHIRFQKLRRSYVRSLAFCLRHRWWVVAACTIMIFGCIPLIFVIGIDMYASEEIPRLYVFVDLPEGTSLDITDDVIKQVEEAAFKFPKSEIVNVIANTGLQQRQEEWQFSPSIGQLVIELTNRRERERTTDKLIDDLRRDINQIAGIKSLEFMLFQNGPPAKSAVEVKIRGPQLDDLQDLVELTKDELRRIPGVHDISDDFVPGKRELQITIDEERAALVGLTVAQAAATIHYAFEGGVATEIRDGDEEIDVVVKYTPDSRASTPDIENVKIATPMGSLVSLKDIADFKLRQGYSKIRHDDLKRAITIKADVDERLNSAVAVNREIAERFAEVANRYGSNDYDMVFRGQFEEFEDAFGQLGELFVVGLMLMYIILAGQFKSFFQPLIIFMAIIFCFMGAMLGLLVIGSPFNINNMYGLVALAGVAVNDSLVLISFINEAREQGVRRWRSIMMAGKLRLRPILLTTITTVFGLLPMAIGIGGRSDIWSPLANVMVWGLSIGTLLTLFVVPAIYATLGDIKRMTMGRRFVDDSGHIISRIPWRQAKTVDANGRRIRLQKRLPS